MTDSREIVVSFTLSKEEAQRETDAIAKHAGAGRTAVWSQRISAILWLGLGAMQVATNHSSGRGWFDMALGGAYAAIVIVQKVNLKKISPGDTTIRFSEAGVFFERPAVEAFPWNAIRSIRRSDTAYFLDLRRAATKAPREPEIVIPTSALGENRIALWALAERMMIGPLRAVSTQLSLDRSGALRRTDAASIVYREPKRA